MHQRCAQGQALRNTDETISSQEAPEVGQNRVLSVRGPKFDSQRCKKIKAQIRALGSWSGCPGSDALRLGVWSP